MVRTILLVTATVLVFAAPNATRAQLLTDATLSSIEGVESDVMAWRRDFHENPELSNREFRTAGIVAAHLESLGIETMTGVAHTGVVGILRGGKPGPVVALRADMDGLPVTERPHVPFASTAIGEYNGEEVGVSHACGHDTHVAIMMGVATVLSGMRDELPGTVKFIFQPAEEGTPFGEDGGAKMMLDEGVLENPDVDAAFALHINAGGDVGTLEYKARGFGASVDDMQIVVKGKQSHGAYPWMGADPIVAASQIVTALQTVVSRNHPVNQSAAVVTIGSIHGGVRSNIIPEEVTMLGTIRALDPERRPMIHEDIRRIATNVAEGMGTTAEVTIPYSMHYPVLFNDPELTAQMLPALQEAAGAENVKLVDAETGAEDFSFFANEVPGFYYNLGGKPVDVPKSEAADHHTPDFYIDEAALPLGVKSMVAVTLSYLGSTSE